MILLSELDVSELLLDKIRQELDLGNRVFQISLNGEIKYFSTNIKDSCLGLHFKLDCLESGQPYIVSLNNGKEIGLKLGGMSPPLSDGEVGWYGGNCMTVSGHNPPHPCNDTNSLICGCNYKKSGFATCRLGCPGGASPDCTCWCKPGMKQDPNNPKICSPQPCDRARGDGCKDASKDGSKICNAYQCGSGLKCKEIEGFGGKCNSLSTNCECR